MKHKNMDKLESVLLEVSNPGHPDYGKYWTKEQISDLTIDIVGNRKVIHYLESHGAFVTKSSHNMEYISAEAPIAVWENILNTKFYEFSHADWKEKKMIRALSYSVPVELDAHIGYIFDVTNFPPHISSGAIKMPYKAPASSNLKNSPASRLYPGYVTPQFLSDYYHIKNNTGSARTKQACFNSLNDHLSAADLTTFQNYMGLPIDGIDGVIGQSGYYIDTSCVDNNCFEPNLDFQYIMGVAQRVSTYMYYYHGADYWAMLTNITNSINPPSVMSISYGGYGYSNSQVAAFNTLAIKAGVRGISILAGSGDDGVVNFGIRNGAYGCSYVPAFPASSPYVTAVGATQVSGDDDSFP